MIKIPQNSYTQPTEVREEVVQAICDAFLHRPTVFHPYRDGRCRDPHRFVVKNKRSGEYIGFRSKPFDWEEGIRFTGAEMKRAFEELIKAGYYMLRVYSYGSWMGYECNNNPCDDFWSIRPGLVTSFEDRID